MKTSKAASSPAKPHPCVSTKTLHCAVDVPPCRRACRFKNGQGSGLDGGHYRIYINGTLEIKRARAEDEGTYTCVANSMLGKAENQVRLEIKGQSLRLHNRAETAL